MHQPIPIIVTLSACLTLPIACDKKPEIRADRSALAASSNTSTKESVPSAEVNTAEETGHLARELAARAKSFGAKAPDDVKAKYAAGLQAVVDAKTVDGALQVGQPAPDFRLKNATGETVQLSRLLKNGPVVLTWYRGGWCPYCNIALRAMQKQLPAFRAAGAQLVAISPELPDKTLSTQEKHDLEFHVLSDPKNEVAEKYQVVFELTPDVAKIYQQKFKLHEWNGDSSNKLPLAATYVLAPSGKVHWAFLNADYRKRAEPEHVLKALSTIAK